MYSAGKLCDDPRFDGRRSQPDILASLDKTGIGQSAMDEADEYSGSQEVGNY